MCPIPLAATPDDDPFDEAVWRRLNPALGVFLDLKEFSSQADQAKRMHGFLNAFLNHRLNMRIAASAQWLSMEGWAAGQTKWTAEFRAELEDRPCYVGCDLASKNDLAAVVRLIPPSFDDAKWYCLPAFWTPENGLKERGLISRVPYEEWRHAGWLKTCSGDRIDNRDIATYIKAIPQPIQIGFDHWNAGDLMNGLLEHYDREDAVLDVSQGFGLSEANKELEVLVAGGQFDAGGHPVMAWNVSNAVIERNAEDRIKLTKSKARGKIDGVVAACTALKLHLIGEPAEDSLLDQMARGDAPAQSLYV